MALLPSVNSESEIALLRKIEALTAENAKLRAEIRDLRFPPRRCHLCDGRGYRTSDEPFMQMATSKCTECNGTGREA